ncbi:MAG: hypothetical protein GKR94_28645 [Gammaproteobacteria bacterium]|nr:hypothetical protein [Gammaproteobacteria bacterium]
MADAQALRAQLADLDGVQSAELSQVQWLAEPGSKADFETMTAAAVILALVPVPAQLAGPAVIDWLRAYFTRPNQPSEARVAVMLDSGARVVVAFNAP